MRTAPLAVAVVSSLLLGLGASTARGDDAVPPWTASPPAARPSTTILPETSATLTVIGGAVAIPAVIAAPGDTGDGVGVLLGGAVGWLAVSGTTLAISMADPGPTYHDSPGGAAAGLVFMTLGGSVMGVGVATLAAAPDTPIGPASLGIGGAVFGAGAIPFALGTRSTTEEQVAEDERLRRVRASGPTSSTETTGQVLTGVGGGLMTVGGIVALAGTGEEGFGVLPYLIVGGALGGTGLVCVAIGVPLWVSGANEDPPPKLSLSPGLGSLALRGEM